jgi:thiol-disulfide isomerase/thioredoxin
METTNEQNKKPVANWPVYVVILALAGVLVWALRARSTDQPGNIQEVSAELKAKLTTPAGTDAQQPEIVHNHTAPSLLDIVKQRRTWDVAWIHSYGKPAPDFEFTAVDGKKVKLSDHKGKNVLLVFWATWCGPCIIEIPHLIELRNHFSKDELTILAVSDEHPDKVKRFAESKKINYTAGTFRGQLPRPFIEVQTLPSAFYIDKQGKIKLGTRGIVSLAESTAIIKATR